jgi:hypothetical protein
MADSVACRPLKAPTTATDSGVDLSGGDHADAVTDGGPDVPPDAEPDLKDIAAAARQATSIPPPESAFDNVAVIGGHG